MITLATVFAICCLTAQARPGFHEQGHGTLDGVPGLDDYGKLHYPQFEVLDLGSEAKGHVPPKVIKITKHIKVTETKPYPVKVPYPVHVPVPVAKPYPVVKTKLLHVPQPYPVEVVKKVPVPVEVPKPYPVPKEEYAPPHHEAAVSDYGHSYGGSVQELDHGHDFKELSDSYGVPGQEHGLPLGGHEYPSEDNGLLKSYEAYQAASAGGGSTGDGHGEYDQSSQYAAVSQPDKQEGGWMPSSGNPGGDGSGGRQEKH